MFEYDGEQYYMVSFPGSDECEVACPQCQHKELLMAVNKKLKMILVDHEGNTHTCASVTKPQVHNETDPINFYGEYFRLSPSSDNLQSALQWKHKNASS